MKAAELTGAALDWAVAKCEGKIDRCGEVTRTGNQLYCWEDGERMRYAPSDNWAQGGPIIDREINRLQEITDGLWEAEAWGVIAEGPAALVAAMRCYVAVELGDEVDVPEGLQ